MEKIPGRQTLREGPSQVKEKMFTRKIWYNIQDTTEHGAFLSELIGCRLIEKNGGMLRPAGSRSACVCREVAS